jgi:site-specific recombinase XerD
MASSTKLSPRSRELYAHELRMFARNLDNPLFDDLSPHALLQWNQMLYDAGAATNTMGTKHKALRKFLTYLEEFPENKEAGDHARDLLRVAKRFNTPTDREPPRKPFALEEAQVIKMLDAAGKAIGGRGPRDRAIIHFFWATGVRSAELGNIRVGDLDLAQRIASVTGKGNKVRTVVFDAACQQDLAKWLEVRAHCLIQGGVDQLFVTAGGRPLQQQDISRIVRVTAKAAGLRKEVWTHVFRHTRVTSLLNKGMAIQDVASFAGHSNIQTTLGYFHQDPTKLRDEYDKATRPRRKRPAESAPEIEAEEEDHAS